MFINMTMNPKHSEGYTEVNLPLKLELDRFGSVVIVHCTSSLFGLLPVNFVTRSVTVECVLKTVKYFMHRAINVFILFLMLRKTRLLSCYSSYCPDKAL